MAVDGRAFASPAGGVRRYVSELYRALGEVAPDLVVEAIGAPPDSVLPPPCRAVPEGPSPPTNLGRHLVGLPLTLARRWPALYHAPAYVSPVWGGVPLVVSVHDIVYASRPEWYPYRRDPFRRWFYRHSVARADLVLVPSTFTADEVLRVYGIPAARIRVIPLAPAAAFHEAVPPAPEAREPLLLHVGDLHPRRDLPCAVDVLRRLCAEGRRPWRLVLVGHDRGSLADVRAVARDAGVADRIEHVTGASEQALREWYAKAFALIYPSRYEGFGLPVAEAMAAGLPVVAADAGSVPEVLGGAGALFEPGDAAAASAQLAALADPATYRTRQVEGARRAAALTWARTASLTVAAFREVARG